MKSMTKDALEKDVKKFVSKCLIRAKKVSDREILKSIWGQAFGVIQFSCDELFKEYNEDLAEWYEENIWKEFRELEFRCI